MLMLSTVFIPVFTRQEPVSAGSTTWEYYGDNLDGVILTSVNAWAISRGLASGVSLNDTSSNYNKALGVESKRKYSFCRSFVGFDTSNLSTTCTITGASLFIYGYGNGQSAVSAQEWIGGHATLVVGDYNNLTLNSGEYGHTSSWSTSGYNEIVFNDLGKGNISKTGFTYIALREYTYDYLNSIPDVNKFNGMYYNEGTYPPYLSVTFTVNAVPTVDYKTPVNGTTGVAFSGGVTCYAYTNDTDGDNLTITWATNASGGGFVNKYTNTSEDANGTESYTFTDFDTGSTKYWWKVYVNDSTVNISEVYHFTTTSFIWIDITNSSWDIGNIIMSSSTWTNETGKTFIADKDNCTVATDLKLQITNDGTTWNSATSGNIPSNNIYRLNVSINSWVAQFQIITASLTTISTNIAADQNETFDLRFDAPTASSTGNQQSITVTATLVQH